METWEKIDDEKVRHIWKRSCTCGRPETVIVNPDFYNENGIPWCECDEDLIYSHTEILIEKII